jgi:hypothetical protein
MDASTIRFTQQNGLPALWGFWVTGLPSWEMFETHWRTSQQPVHRRDSSMSIELLVQII